MQDVVIFDLDGTLLSADSTKIWLTTQLKSNPLRFIGALVIFPIAMLLMKIERYKAKGISLFFWLATYKLSKIQLIHSFENFAQEVKTHHSKIRWFKDGINELNKHLISNRHVIVVTASPEWLAQTFINSLNLPIEVLGTPLIQQYGGWIGGKHCRLEEKVNRLKARQIQIPWFATYSDDLKDDYPILSLGQSAYLINSKANTSEFKHLDWS